MITLLEFYEQTQLHGADVEHIVLATPAPTATRRDSDTLHPWEADLVCNGQPFARPSRSNS